MRKLSLLMLLVALLALGCGQDQKVGDERLLDFEEQENAEALGREPEATEKALSLDAATATPARPTPTPRPAATPVIFDLRMVTDSPYYKPGNCVVIAKGVTLKVTNNDTVAERADGRSFTDEGGAFHSGMLKPGQSWTWVFDQVGSYKVIDEGLTFARLTLHVGQGSC